MDENPLSSTGWAVIESYLPKNWREIAKAQGLCRSIILRDGTERSKLSNPEHLLRLILHHVQTGCGLGETVAAAAQAKLVKVSKVALHYRLRDTGDWLSEMAASLTGSEDLFDAPRWAGFRIFCTDATSGSAPGAPGTTFRVHYRIHAQTLRPHQIYFTDATGGETLKRFESGPGDLDLVDRGYSNPPGIEHSVVQGGDLIVRVNRGTLPLQDRTGRPFDLEGKVLRLRTRDQSRSWVVRVQCETCTVFGRVVAVRLPRRQAAQARARAQRELGQKTTERDLRWAEYVVLFTTVPETLLPDEAILALYRLRWQVELHIKRDKSLGGLAGLPNHREDTIRSWVCAKLLLGALARRMVSEAFPPGEAGAGEDAA